MISCVTCTIRDENMENVFINFQRQKIQEKELIIILNKDNMDFIKWEKNARKYKDVRVLQVPEATSLGECLNRAIMETEYNIIAKMDDDDYYGSNYLKNSLKYLELSGAKLVGKSAFYLYFQDEKLLTIFNPKYESKIINIDRRGKFRNLCGGTLVFLKEVWSYNKFPDVTVGEDTSFQKKYLQSGGKIYSSTIQDYVSIRRKNPERHTWKIESKEIKAMCIEVAYTNDFKSLIDNGG
ncbi:glycosyltransferase [Sutcliffiella horikoshii]|uniref:glycosyltransferase n=1 Tax=Sutcliffiella horikoshii TaxID=79883 RepID=UPI001F23EE72|nr:glycosyltransferase [Sutcliffiella horikoshii]MCG1020148.1 glycosyltransferase [Sutcliffiella horikoshii]